MTHLLSNECRLGGGPSGSRKLTTETKGELLRRIGIRGVEGRNCEWKPTWKSGIRTRVVFCDTIAARARLLTSEFRSKYVAFHYPRTGNARYTAIDIRPTTQKGEINQS